MDGRPGPRVAEEVAVVVVVRPGEREMGPVVVVVGVEEGGQGVREWPLLMGSNGAWVRRERLICRRVGSCGCQQFDGGRASGCAPNLKQS